MDASVVIAMTALTVALGYIVYLQGRMEDAEEACAEAEEALQAADEAIQAGDDAIAKYHQILTDVANKQSTVKVTPDGQIIATGIAYKKVSVH